MRGAAGSGSADVAAPSSIRDHLLAAAICLLLSLLFVAPWFPNARTVPTVYSPDVERYARIDISMWTHLLAWGARHPERFYDGQILVPLRNALASNDHRMTEGIWTIPLFRLFEPLTAWGLAILIALWTTSWATWLAGWRLTGSRWGGATAAILFGFGLFRANHVVHIEGLFNPCLPLALVAMVFWFERPTWHRGILCALLTTGALIEYSYIAVAFGLILPPVFFFGVWHRRLPFLRGLAPLIGALLLAALLLLPIGRVYLAHHRETELTRSLLENHFGSADHRTWITAPTGQVLPPFGPQRATHPDDQMFPGYVLLFLGLLGAPRLFRRSPELALCGLAGLAISFGTWRLLWWRLGWDHLTMPTPYELLHDLLLPVKAVRSPARHGVVFHLVLSFAAAFGTSRILAMRRGSFLAALILSLAFIEARAGMREIILLPEKAHDPVYDFLAATEMTGAVLELPMDPHVTGADRSPEIDYLFTALRHGRPTPNGTMGLHLPWHGSLAVHMARPRPFETPAILRASGIRHVVVHDLSLRAAWEAIGLRLVHESPSGIAVFEVDSPLSVPRTPAELQERLFDLPHHHLVRGDAGFAGAIKAPDRVRVRAGEPYSFPIVVENQGTISWCANGRIFGLGSRGDLVVGLSRWPGPRPAWPRDMRDSDLTAVGLLPGDVAPGETARVLIRGLAPVRSGEYSADLDFQSTAERWMHGPDSAPAATRLIVEAFWN